MSLLGVAGVVGGLLGGSRPTGPTVERVDGARWSAKKQYWELPPGTRAAVQSPKPRYPGLQDMHGNVAGAAASVAPAAGTPQTVGGVLQRIDQALAPAPAAPSSWPASSPTSPDMLVLYAMLAAGVVLITIAARR